MLQQMMRFQHFHHSVLLNRPRCAKDSMKNHDHGHPHLIATEKRIKKSKDLKVMNTKRGNAQENRLLHVIF